jgi:hypothetical protein
MGKHPNKVQKQISFIKANGRFQLDIMDILFLLFLLFGFIVAGIGFYKVYQQGHVSFSTLFIIEAILLFSTLFIPFKYINTFSFQVIHTRLPFEANKDRIISYLRRKGLEVIYSPADDSILMAHMISLGFTSRLMEMTVICLDHKILLNIRSAYGKDIWNFQKDNRLYKREIEEFIHH